jgi:hypothetical protein
MIHHYIESSILALGQLKWWSVRGILARNGPDRVGKELKTDGNVLFPSLSLEPEVKGRAALFMQFFPVDLKQHVP